MDKDKFNSHNKTGKARYSLLRKFEKQLVTHFVPHVGSFFETYELTWLTLLWSIAVVICSYFAKSNILWLNGVSAAIILHYITDLFDGAVGRSKKTGLVKWGFYMDHFFDYVFLCSLMIGYSFLLDQRYSYLFIFLLALFAGYMINSFLEFSATNYFRISYFGVSPTEINVLFVILNTCVIFFGTAILLSILPYLILGSFFVLAFIVYRTQKNIWRRDMVAKKESTKEEKRAIRLKYKYFRRKYVISLLIFLFFYLNFYVFITNPFNSWSIIKNPFTTTVENNQIVLHQSFSVNVEENIFQKAFAFYKSGVHIFANAYIGSKKAPSSTVAGIIADIHKLRFDPTKPYLISGDQFSVFYPRNLGVFYSALLNPNTALNKTDWENKERLYLQTTAYALDAFANADTIFTTIVPIGFHSVTGINIYAYPSDSLYGVLYALQQMQNLHNNNATYHLQTVAASQELLYSYHDNLQSLLKKYEQTVFDTKTGLVKKNIHLSS
ncbi:MAG: CDP-alcohol phosphatidyltransferase family protein, partial [Candidatus Levyibacteriota bacterium]